MTGISHKQAIRLIHARLDGLLSGDQARLLDEHLESCESCRAYAAAIGRLPTTLQDEFHERWDKQGGPSERALEQMTTRAQMIPNMNRLSSAARLAAGLAGLLALGFLINFVVARLQSTSGLSSVGETANSSLPAKSPLLAFASEGSGNLEIYTMRLDDSGLANITNHPANDYSPAWSPDGTRIAFVSNRDRNDDIYVMNADGSALTRITEDPTPEMVPVWSPDGTRIAYASRDPDTRVADLYVSDSNGQNRRRLREDVPEMVWPETWSPDSRYLFFLVNGQVFRVDVSSGETTTITADEDVYSQFVLSKDGARLLYLSWCGQNAAEFCSTVKSTNADGTDGETHATVQLPQVCTAGEPSRSNTSEHYEMIKWSPDRTKLLFAFYCEGSGGWFYIANADGSDFKSLTSYPILYKASGYEWSPDSQSVIFSTTLDSSYSDGIYLLNIDDALRDPATRPTSVNASMPGIATFAWQPTP